MIRTLVDFALNNRFVVIAIALLLIFWEQFRFIICLWRPIRILRITT